LAGDQVNSASATPFPPIPVEPAKFHAYRKVPSLQEYLLISSDTPRIERFLRQDNPDWLYTEVTGLESHLALPSLDCTLALADVYRKVTFDADKI